MKVNAIECLKCGATVYSRTRHDMRFCPCGAVAIDGGRSYIKICGEPDDYKQRIITVKVTDKVLYNDWNKRIDKYGIIAAKVTKVLSCEEYVKHQGMMCPACKGRNITSGNLDPSGINIFSTSSCSACGATWTDVHALVGYSELEIPGRLFKPGDKVEVLSNKGDTFNDFIGTVVEYVKDVKDVYVKDVKGLVDVRDQDDNVWTCGENQLEKI